MKKQLYHYKAFVTSVYDGDTITVDIDLGMNIILKSKKVRLYGINAPEMRGDEKALGKITRDWLRQAIDGKAIIIQTIKDKTGKYGRLLGVIWLEEININELMINENLAQKKDY